MKRRCGVGLDISNLRPAGVATTNAAKTSTGAVSFMNRFSNTTREVAQNGRRGALMISMDVNHPDVMDFVTIKRDLTKITGANISVKMNDEFMKAVERDEDYIYFPSLRTVEYSLFHRSYLKKKKLQVNDVMDIRMSSFIPYVDEVITEGYQADVYRKAKGHIKELKNLEVYTLRDLIK